MSRQTDTIPADVIAPLIRSIRDRRVILDSDLAGLYGVPTKRLNEQYRRNLDRFPEDFAFQLTQEEWAALRSQFATLETGRGSHRKYLHQAKHSLAMISESRRTQPEPERPTAQPTRRKERTMRQVGTAADPENLLKEGEAMQ